MNVAHRFSFSWLTARGLLVMACLSFAWIPVTAQETAAARPADEAVSTRPDYQIGPGDLIALSVAGLKQFDRSARVSNSGKIHVPHLGVIKVADMTPAQLQSTVAALLRERGLVKDPWVYVRVEEYRARPVYILGEVLLPGQFVIKDEMYLTDLITLAFGFNEFATPVGYLYRRRADADALPPGEAAVDEAILIDFKALNEGRRPDLNYKLQGGDILYVPQRRKEHFFVVGDVGKPGAFEITYEESRILLSQAVSKAGGPLKTAKMSKTVVARFGADGALQQIPVDFKAVLEGRQPDFEVRADDIVFIPGSTAKTLGYGLLGAIPQVVSQNTAR